MSALALLLVLVAAALHAGWNLLVKRASADDSFLLLVVLAICVVWSPVGLWGLFAVVPAWGWKAWAAVLASGFAHVWYFRCLLRGYRESDLTVVYPVARGTGPLLSSSTAVLLLGERLQWLGAGGVAAITVGVFLIAGGPALWRTAHDPARRDRVRAGVAWGSATGALICAYTLIDGYAVKVLMLSPIVFDYFCNLARLPLVLPGGLRDRDRLLSVFRSHARLVIAVAIASPLAYILVLYAMQLAPLSHVAPAREVSMLFAAVVGGKLLGEGDRALRIVGAACIALGVVALAI